MQLRWEWLQTITEKITACVWGPPMLLLLLGSGVYFTVRTRFFQLTHFKLWLCIPFGGRRKKRAAQPADAKAISPFQAMATALAASLGTGNIAGVATAVTIGGPGAVFWMWISALFGMMISFAENALGIYYRRKNSKGEWCGGAMYTIWYGLQNHKLLKPLARPLAMLFALFCTLASFGIGNLAQVNTIAGTMKNTFQLPPMLTGISIAFFTGLIILGGVKRIGAVAEKLVPIMALLYMAGALIVIGQNFDQLLPAFASIFKGAFGIRALSGGISGTLMREALSLGVKRGVFSHEAGMGSSVLVHCASSIKEPAEQGMWGMFEVFFDTIVMCTLTALVILMPGTTGAEGATLVAKAFAENGFGMYGSAFIAISILFFAFSTCLGWSFYGAKCVEYLLGQKAVGVYRVLFILCMLPGAMADMGLIWSIADNFNALMAVPNLIGVLAQTKLVLKILDNYLARKVQGTALHLTPLLSYHAAEAYKTRGR